MRCGVLSLAVLPCFRRSLAGVAVTYSMSSHSLFWVVWSLRWFDLCRGLAARLARDQQWVRVFVSMRCIVRFRPHFSRVYVCFCFVSNVWSVCCFEPLVVGVCLWFSKRFCIVFIGLVVSYSNCIRIELYLNCICVFWQVSIGIVFKNCMLETVLYSLFYGSRNVFESLFIVLVVSYSNCIRIRIVFKLYLRLLAGEYRNCI